MRKTLSIGITTFRNRIEDLKKLIMDIRTFDKNIDILLAVNTNFGEKMPEDYRQKLFKLCLDYPNIYPLVFPRYTGLAKMFNNLIVHAPTTHIFLMGDDTTFSNPMTILSAIAYIQTREIFEVNWGFGTLVISKKLAHELGYFDERYIAFGHEDNDFMQRYHRTYSHKIEEIPFPGVRNNEKNGRLNSYDVTLDCFVDPGIGGHKPKINRFIDEIKIEEKWELKQQYPYEEFLEKNRHNIGKMEEVIKEGI